MRSVDLTLDSATARSLAVEASLLEFETIDAYLKWLVENRFDLDVESERGKTLAEHADRIDTVDADSDVAAVAEAATTADLETDDRNGEADRIRDEELSAAADALSSVEDNQLDLFATNAVSQTQRRLGETNETRIQYDTGDESGHPVATNADLDSLDLPGRDPALLDSRRQAVGAAFAFLREVEEATRSDFIEELYESYPAGYESESSWWDCITSGLRQIDRVDPAGQSRRVWRYRTSLGRITRISYE